MATEPTPTDAEIDEIYRATFLGMPNVARQPLQTVPPMVRDFARAVLTRWGVLRADKIVIPTDTMEQEFQKHYRRGYEAGLRARPAPAASQKPLTVGQIREMERNHVYSQTATLTDFARAIERAHGIGIKGGQHGDDT